MGIREVINKVLPATIPDFTYLDEYDEVQNRIYFGFIPEDEENTPSMAYVIEDQGHQRDLEGYVFASWANVKFGIISKDVLELESIKEKLMDLCGPAKLGGVRFIEFIDGGDADPDLTLQNNLVGIELSFKFHL